MKIGFVDAKVKSKINKTLPWLCSKPHNEQEKIIKLCIGQAQKMKLLIHTHELNIAEGTIGKNIAVIEESYKRKYRVLQKAMQNCVWSFQRWMNPT